MRGKQCGNSDRGVPRRYLESVSIQERVRGGQGVNTSWDLISYMCIDMQLRRE